MPDLPPRTALILVDLQKAVDHRRWARHGPRNNPAAEAAAAALLGRWRRLGWPIIHVRHDSTEPDSTYKPGGAGHAFKPEVAPAAGETIIAKQVNSAFIGTDLEARLRRAGQQTVVLIGLTTEHCVSTTARMAGNLGFTTYVIGDATATFDKRGPDGTFYPAETVHGVSLASLHGEFATVVDTATVLRELSAPVG